MSLNVCIPNTIDSVFDYFDANKKDLVRSAIDVADGGKTSVNNKIDYDKYIPNDNMCLFKVCSHKSNDHLLSQFACMGCRYMRKLTDLKQYKFNDNIIIACGRKIGTMVKITKEYFDADYFYNQILVDSILDFMATLPHHPNFYYAFICQDNAYSLIQSFNSNTNDTLTINAFPMLVINLLKQLTCYLDSLSVYSFLHNVQLANIYFESKECRYQYKGLNIKSPTTLKLYTPNSRIIIQDKCFGTDCNNIYQIQSYPMASITEDKDGNVSINVLEYYYITQTNKIANSSEKFNTVIDMYQYFCLLMTNPHFYRIIYSDNILASMWQLLWRDEDFPKIEAMVKTNTVNLMNIYLRKDLFPYLLDCLKRLP